MWIKRFALALACFLCLRPAAAPAGEAPVRLYALNVGKADCLLLCLEEETYLIDAGLEQTYGALRTALEQLGVSRLNGVFLTHCDKDHYGGLMQLAQSAFTVDAWYAAALYYDIKRSGHPMTLAADARGESVCFLSAGDTLTLGSSLLTVLGPRTLNTENENNNSLVFRVDTPEGSLLFTGDMKLDEERELLQCGAFAPCDVLKVPFHGDNTASSDAFVALVAPQLALISTSTAEEPDTPASSVLKRYGRVGATCLVTQDYALGVEITLQNGHAQAQPISWQLPDYSGHLRARIDGADDVLTLLNSTAEDIPLAGWIVYSSRGETSVPLPDDAVLPANGVYKIGTRETTQPVDLSLDQKRLWHKSKLDQAIVYDAGGRIAALTDNGLPE